VQAVNAIGESDFSDVAYFIVADLPAAPAAPTMDASTKDSITLAWNAPGSDGGNSISGYKVYMNDLLSDVWELVYDGTNFPSTLTYTKTGLEAGNYYRFKVAALNGVGEGSSSPSATLLASDYPSAPGQPQLVSSTATQVIIEWSPPSDNGGATITGYEVFHKKSTQDESNWASVGTADINTLQFTHNGLSGTDDVQYKVRATSNKGAGAFSVRNTFILASTPTITVAPVKVEATKTSITVSWALTSDGGASVLGYRLYMVNVTTGGTSLVYDGKSIPTVTSHKVTGLSPGHEYEFYATAINRVGEGSESPSSATIKAATVPGQPAPPVYVSSTSTTITMTFTPVADNGGSVITGYKLYRDTGTLVSSTNTLVGSYTGTSMSFTIDQSVETALVTGTKYKFRIAAENALGEGEPSFESRFALAANVAKPATPTVDPSKGTLTSLYVSWAAVAAGDIDTDGYLLYMAEQGSGEFTLIYDGSKNPDILAMNVTGL